MSILDEMKHEKQETESSSTASSPSEPTNAEVIAAVNKQTKAVNGLKSYLQVVIEETVREQLKDLSSTSQSSATTSPQIENVANRLSEIETTLSEFVQSLDGKRLNAASQSLIKEAQKSHAATASAIEKLTVQADESRTLVSKVGGAVQRIEERTEERVQKAVEQVVGEATATMTAELDASTERAEKLQAVNDRIEARQLWSSVAALTVAAMPWAMIVAGVWMSVAAIWASWGWALDVDGNFWLGVGRWMLVILGTAGAIWALVLTGRWVTGLVEIWRGRSLPKWPSWRK